MNESFLFPYDLMEKPKVRKMTSELGSDAESDLLKIFLRIKKGRGQYPMEALMLLAEGKKRRQSRLRKIINNYQIFKVEHGMVSFRRDLLQRKPRKDTPSGIEDQIQELEGRDNSGSLFPEALDEMDDSLKQQLTEKLDSYGTSAEGD